jgi:hypothetical protein
MPTDPDDEKKPGYRQLVDGLSTPAVLYFPFDVLGQLNELCELHRLTPAQLIIEAIKSQDARLEEFIEEVMTPLEPGEPEIWPEDPLKSLASVLLIHLFRVLHQKLNDPAGFAEFKKNAPSQWSFSSLEQPDADPEPADWWKEDEL